jgi:hypothetical protein
MSYKVVNGKSRPLVTQRSLMQPFLVGSPVGRGKQGNGEAVRLDDDRWRAAFPDCVHNGKLGGMDEYDGGDVYARKVREWYADHTC